MSLSNWSIVIYICSGSYWKNGTTVTPWSISFFFFFVEIGWQTLSSNVTLSKLWTKLPAMLVGRDRIIPLTSPFWRNLCLTSVQHHKGQGSINCIKGKNIQAYLLWKIQRMKCNGRLRPGENTQHRSYPSWKLDVVSLLPKGQKLTTAIENTFFFCCSWAVPNCCHQVSSGWELCWIVSRCQV